MKLIEKLNHFIEMNDDKNFKRFFAKLNKTHIDYNKYNDVCKCLNLNQVVKIEYKPISIYI